MTDNPFGPDKSALERLAEAKSGSKTDDALVKLAGRLDWSPKKNWVEQEGGLPKFIEDIALALIRGGKTRETAIQIAIGRCKAWAAGGDGVKPDTQAKAAAAITQWTKMKASAKARPNK